MFSFIFNEKNLGMRKYQMFISDMEQRKNWQHLAKMENNFSTKVYSKLNPSAIAHKIILRLACWSNKFIVSKIEDCLIALKMTKQGKL